MTMTWSRCYTESEGNLSCVTCHDPHRNVETSTVANEAKCLICHAPDAGQASTAAASDGDGSATATIIGKTTTEHGEGPLSHQSLEGLPCLPHAACLAAGDAFFQDRSLYSRSRPAPFGERLRHRRNGMP